MTEHLFVNCRPLVEGTFTEPTSIHVSDGLIAAINTDATVFSQTNRIDCGGDYIAPGLVDIQVNGGGGILFNDAPTPAALEQIAMAHIRSGTTSILPTLISDKLSTVDRGLRAVETAIENNIPGIIGIHLEGPCLGAEKAGVHNKKHFKLLSPEAVELFSSLKLGVTLVTLAPEAADPSLITALADRGVIVSLGHSNAPVELVQRALESGASGFTHLFNAMSQLKNRSPGMVGTALMADNAWAGLIVDGHHVDLLSLQIAHRTKPENKIIYVSDAMPIVGSTESTFTLGNEAVQSVDGALRTQDGTLAGSAICLWEAVKNAQSSLNVSLGQALLPATRNPSDFLGLDQGEIRVGAKADFIRINAKGELKSVYMNGVTSIDI